MNRRRLVIYILPLTLCLIAMVVLGIVAMNRTTEMDAKRCIVQWVSGNNDQRVNAWKQLVDRPGLAREAAWVAERDRATVVNNPMLERWLAAMPAQKPGAEWTRHARALCQLLDVEPTLPEELQSLVPDKTVDALQQLVLSHETDDETRLRAFVWLVQCDRDSDRPWQQRVPVLCDLVATRLVEGKSSEWLTRCFACPRAQAIFSDWVSQVSEFGLEYVSLPSVSSLPDLSRYRGRANDRCAFALTIPFHKLDSVCAMMAEDGYRVDAIDENKDAVTCNVIWRRDGLTSSIEQLDLDQSEKADDISKRLDNLRSSGKVIWDVAASQIGEKLTLYVITLAQTDAHRWFHIFGEFDDLNLQIRKLPHVYADPRCIRVFPVGESEWAFLRCLRGTDQGWMVSYAEHWANLRRRVESEPRRYYQLDFSLPRLPILRYGSERRQAAEIVLEQAPENLVARRLLSRCLFYEGEYQGFLDTIDDIEKDSADYVYAALSAANIGDENQADRYIEALPENLAPGFGEYVRANTLAALGRVDEAIELLDRSVSTAEDAVSYNVACAYSLLLQADGVDEQQRKHLIEQAMMILKGVFESGDESFTNMLEDNDMQPLLAIPEARSHFGIVDDSYLAIRAVSITSPGYTTQLIECAAGDPLMESLDRELRDGAIPVAFLPDEHASTLSVWVRPFWNARAGAEWARKQASVLAVLDPHATSELLCRLWKSHPYVGFRAAVTNSLAIVRSDPKTTKQMSDDAQVDTDNACVEIRRSVDHWRLIQALDKPALFADVVDSLSTAWTARPELTKRLDYLTRVVNNERELVDSDESMRWVGIDMTAAFPDYEQYEILALATEVPVGPFRQFLLDQPEWGRDQTEFGGKDSMPVTDVTWHQAAAFCNWFSAQQGMNSDQFMYESLDASNPQLGMVRVADHEQRFGYRLMEDRERDFLVKGDENLRQYAPDVAEKFMWVAETSGDRIHPPATRLPNRWGLYDLFGNVKEWSDDATDAKVASTLGGSAITSLDDFTTGVTNLSLPKHASSPWVGFRIVKPVRVIP